MSLTDYLASKTTRTQQHTMENYAIVSDYLLRNPDKGLAENVSDLNVRRYHE